MDVVEKSESRVEREIVIMHDDEVKLLNHTSESQAEQIGPQMMVEEVGFPLVQEVKSSLSTPQNDEVFQVLETASTEASPQGVLKSEAPVFEKALPVVIPQDETRFFEEFSIVKPASNMRSESEICATEERGSDYVQTKNVESKFEECSRIERKFTCSEEASVDVHSGDSAKQDTTKDFLKAVNTVDLAFPLQKSSEEFAGVAREAELRHTLAAKWIHEVSIDVFIPDAWVEVEMSSVTEPEASTAGIAPSLASEKTLLGLVSVEHVKWGLIERPSAIGATELEKQGAPQVFEKGTDIIELEKQGRELISQSLGIEEPITGTEREIAFEKSKSMNLPEQALPDSVEWNSDPSNECEMTNQELQVLPIQVAEASKNIVPTSTEDEDIGYKGSLPLTSGEVSESMVWKFAPTQVETINVAEGSPCTSESPVLAEVELTCQRTTDVDSNQDERYVKSTARVPSFTDWGRVPEVDASTTDTMTEELESKSAASKPSEGSADIKEQVRRIWSLKNLKKRPFTVEPRTLTEQAIRPVKPKAPKAIGLAWPPTPLTTAEDNHYVHTNDTASPRQREADSVGATDTIVAEPKEELQESESSPSEEFEGAMDGAEADIKAQNLQRLWSLKYLQTRPVMVGPRTVAQQTPNLVKLTAPKVVGLAWPPAPAMDGAEADIKAQYLQTSSEMVGPRTAAQQIPNLVKLTAPKVVGLSWPPAPAIKAQYLQTRPLMVGPRTAAQQTPKPLKLRAPKVVGLSWPPAPTMDGAEADIKVQSLNARPVRVGPRTAAQQTPKLVKLTAPKVVGLSWPPAPAMNGAEADIKAQYLQTSPVMVGPGTAAQQTPKPVKLGVPKVVGLSWPPAPLIAAPVIM